jgi:hypothetical protein
MFQAAGRKSGGLFVCAPYKTQCWLKLPGAYLCRFSTLGDGGEW